MSATLTTITISSKDDLLKLPNRAVLSDNEGSLYIVIQSSFSFEPHLLAVLASGQIDRTFFGQIVIDQPTEWLMVSAG